MNYASLFNLFSQNETKQAIYYMKAVYLQQFYEHFPFISITKESCKINISPLSALYFDLIMGGEKVQPKKLFFLSSAEENKKGLAATAEVISFLHLHCSQSRKRQHHPQKGSRNTQTSRSLEILFQENNSRQPQPHSSPSQERPKTDLTSIAHLLKNSQPPPPCRETSPARRPLSFPGTDLEATAIGGHILNTSAPHRSGVDVAARPGWPRRPPGIPGPPRQRRPRGT